MENPIFLQSLQLNRVLSFRATRIRFQNLNILIGPNGSGKSNLLDILELIIDCPVSNEQLDRFFSPRGGLSAWYWQDTTFIEIPSISVQVKIPGIRWNVDIPPVIDKGAYWNCIWDDGTKPGEEAPLSLMHIYPCFDFDRNASSLLPQSESRGSQATLSKNLGNIQQVLRYAFNHADPEFKDKINIRLKELNPDFEALVVHEHEGYIFTHLIEGNKKIPLSRLSSGTLKYLCLILILCNPTPPPFIAIDEPDLGLHPDMLPSLKEMLVEASEKTQVLITTHSDILVSLFSDTPEVVMVCEKDSIGSTQIKRLDPKTLKNGLKKHSLGDLWTKGMLGGTRW